MVVIKKISIVIDRNISEDEFMVIKSTFKEYFKIVLNSRRQEVDFRRELDSSDLIINLVNIFNSKNISVNISFEDSILSISK